MYSGRVETFVADVTIKNLGISKESLFCASRNVVKNDVFRLIFSPFTSHANFRLFDSAANKDMMAKLCTNGDTIICLLRKNCGKRRNCSLRAISPFPTMFSKAVCC